MYVVELYLFCRKSLYLIFSFDYDFFFIQSIINIRNVTYNFESIMIVLLIDESTFSFCYFAFLMHFSSEMELSIIFLVQ